MTNQPIFDQLMNKSPFSNKAKRFLSSRMVPNKMSYKISTSDEIFCAQYNSDGNRFILANKSNIYIFDSHTLKAKRKSASEDVSYAILSTDLSEDGKWIAYSSWSPFVHLCNAEGDHEIHEPLLFEQDEYQHFSLFNIKFSQDSREIIGASCNSNVYIYDVERKLKTHVVPSHITDVNTVCFIDKSCQTYISGSDDGLCKIWDKRDTRQPAGVLCGHSRGITSVDSKGDAIYFISNSKDHSVKLWDMRKMVDEEKAPPISSNSQNYEYWRVRRFTGHTSRDYDLSVKTYCGHTVFYTLIKCKFSPSHTTGQKYIYTGSANGIVYIYDVLTGDIVKELEGHERSPVRDMHWHPYNSQLISSSWDYTGIIWNYDPLKKQI